MMEVGRGQVLSSTVIIFENLVKSGFSFFTQSICKYTKYFRKTFYSQVKIEYLKIAKNYGTMEEIVKGV